MSRRTVDLPDVPGLAGLYARAAGRHAASLAPWSKPDRLELPEVAHRVSGVAADPLRLAAYQRLMGDTLRDTLPSVFVHGTAFPVAVSVMTAPGFPLPLLGMVHLANAVEHRRPIAVGERLDLTAWAENLAPHHAGTRVDLVVEARSGGETVWRGVSTYLAKGIWDGPRPARPEGDRPTPALVPAVRTARWRLGADTGREYAAVLGDYNPIHLGAVPAKVLGLKRAIAHGMYLAGRALAATAPVDVGYDWAIGFKAPVTLPARVDFAVEPEEGGTASFTGWNAARGRIHFEGNVVPRGATGS